MSRSAIIASPSELDEIWPDLDEVAVIGLELRDAQFDWSAARVRSTLFLGCVLPNGESDRLVARGAVVLSAFREVPFEPYRADLYTYDELVAGHEAGARATLDARIGAWFTNSSTSLHDAVARALHDATVDAANTADATAVPIHAGVGAPYAHVTAPMRRLADRYANEIVLARCQDSEPPTWAVAALDDLVTTMARAMPRAAAVERAVVDAVECAVLQHHIGARFPAVVVDKNTHGLVVQLRQPAVIAPMTADAALGDVVEVVLVAVDPIARRVELKPSQDTRT